MEYTYSMGYTVFILWDGGYGCGECASDLDWWAVSLWQEDLYGDL